MPEVANVSAIHAHIAEISTGQPKMRTDRRMDGRMAFQLYIVDNR